MKFIGISASTPCGFSVWLLFLVIIFLESVLGIPTSAAATDQHIDALIQVALGDVLKAIGDFDPNQRPFVTLSYAQSIDGKIALHLDDNQEETSPTKCNREVNSSTRSTTSSNLAISGPESLRLTHALRSVHDAILVGGNTLDIDNPRLNNRLWIATREKQPGEVGISSGTFPLQQPRPVILDTHLTHIRKLGNAMRVQDPIVCCSPDAYNQVIRDGSYQPNATPGVKEGKLDNPHNKIPISVTLLPCCTTILDSETEAGKKRIILDLPDVLSRLHANFGIRSLMVEGGASVITQFLTYNTNEIHRKRHRLVDWLCVTVSPKFLGTKGLSSISSHVGNDMSLGPLRCIGLGEDCVLFSKFH